MLVTIGTVLKPRGLKGELKVEILYNRPTIFNNLTSVVIGNRSYLVQKSSVQNGFAYLFLVGVATIEQAETFRRQAVKVASDTLQLAADEVLSTDLIGFSVIQRGKKIGTVQAVENYGGGDFFEIALTGAGYVEVPNEDDFIAETNMTERTLTLTANALEAEMV